MKNELYQSCTLCPRECHADRLSGKKGACGENSVLRVGRAALHMWEEPCISGTRGSGTVFFSGCSLGCIFCQNRELSYGGLGKEISEERLAEIFLELRRKKDGAFIRFANEESADRLYLGSLRFQRD